MPSIAVIGANADRSRYSNRCVRAYLQKGYTVYPINPKESAVEGLKCYASILDVPAQHIDRVSLYVRSSIGLQVLDEMAGKSVGEVWLNPGADAPEVVAKARELGLNAVTACSIVAIGIHPSEMD
jgi:predicted CoA-binding protein